MKILKRIGSVTMVCLMIAAGLYRLYAVTERKASYFKYEPFYQQEENFDVLFMGTSHVINGIFPMELWKEYGIVSYNFGGHANTLATSYWQMVNAFERTKPRLVVIDCQKLSSQEKIPGYDKSLVHLSLDSIPFGVNKVKAVWDLLDDNRDRMDFLFDFSIYHNRWKELKKDDFHPSMTKEKGAESRIGVAFPDKFQEIGREEKLTENTTGMDYLVRTIRYCQERGVDVLLLYLPFPANETQQMEANTVFDIAQEYGLNYLDYWTLKELVDFDTDCYDAHSHLNPSGARKITTYVGQYIMDHYNIADQRENQDYSGWHDAYKQYIQQKIYNIRSQTELKPCLMLLNDKSLSFSICIQRKSAILEDEVLKKLLENAGIDTDKLSGILGTAGVLITVDRCSDLVTYSEFSESQGTPFGQIQVTDDENGLNLYLDDSEKLKLTNPDELGIIVFNNEDFHAIGTRKFRKPEADYMVVRD